MVWFPVGNKDHPSNNPRLACAGFTWFHFQSNMRGFIRSHPLAWFLTSGSTWTRTSTTTMIITIITMIVKLWKRRRKKLDVSLSGCILSHSLFVGCGYVCNLSATTWSERPISMVFKDRKLAYCIMMRRASSFAPTREHVTLGRAQKNEKTAAQWWCACQ